MNEEYTEKDYWEGRVPDEMFEEYLNKYGYEYTPCLLYTSPSPRDGLLSRMPSSA